MYKHSRLKKLKPLFKAHQVGSKVVVSPILELQCSMDEDTTEWRRRDIYNHEPLWVNCDIISRSRGLPVGPGINVTPPSDSEKRK